MGDRYQCPRCQKWIYTVGQCGCMDGCGNPINGLEGFMVVFQTPESEVNDLRAALTASQGRIAHLEGSLASFANYGCDCGCCSWGKEEAAQALATPSAASEVLRAKEALACIVMNAKIGPDAAMNGTTDCYHVPLDDIDAAREILSKEGK